MEELRGILENAISKIEDISCPPHDKDKQSAFQLELNCKSRSELEVS